MHKIQQAKVKQHMTHGTPKKGTIHQPMDHFDRLNDKTLPQVINKIRHTLHSHPALNVMVFNIIKFAQDLMNISRTNISNNSLMVEIATIIIITTTSDCIYIKMT